MFIEFISLFLLEITLNVDNAIFISIIASGCPKDKRRNVEIIGLSAALVLRIIMLSIFAEVHKLSNKIAFEIFNQEVSYKNIIFLVGGLFLIYKSSHTIYDELRNSRNNKKEKKLYNNMINPISEIMFIDVIFSMDSILAVVALTSNMLTISSIVILSFLLILISIDYLTTFIKENPEFHTMALLFILVVGIFMTCESIGIKIDKNYLYSGLLFSTITLVVNLINKDKPGKIKKLLKLWN